MSQARGTLHMLCGKIAAGKSTLARRLAAAPGTILLSEDRLLSTLHPGEIGSLEDFVRCSGRLRAALGPHLVELLRARLSLVLDFQANTPASRAWMRGLAETAGANHRLHYLRASDETCLARLAERNRSGQHEYVVSREQFAIFTSRFVPPMEEEGLKLEMHDQD